LIFSIILRGFVKKISFKQKIIDIKHKIVKGDIAAVDDKKYVWDNEKWVDYTGSTILSDISLTLPQFQNMCVLMGTDYTNRVRTIPVRTAYSAIQSTATLEEAWTGLRQKATDLPALQRAVRMLDGADATLDTLLNEREQAKWLAPAPTIEPAEFKVFKETYFPLIDITEETIALHIEGGTSTEETIAPPI
jgi:hypothetical protein